MKQKNKGTSPAIAAGQVWEMADSKLHVTLIGRTLAHYKHVKTGAVRVPVSLINKADLEQFLVKNKAVLIQS
jgi:hypothetical protein